jgi:hypothetical protein
MIENEKKLQAILGVLPVLIDYMEDIREQSPRVYNKMVKRSGNDFIEHTTRHLNNLFSIVKDVDGALGFYDQVQNVSSAFMQWVDTEPKEEE